jgi:hypothetical protein
VSEKIKTVTCNLYSLTYRASEKFGHCRTTYRVLAMSIEDAMKTCKDSRPRSGHRDDICVHAACLYEGLMLRVSETIEEYVARGDDRPYTDADYRKLLDHEHSGR